MSNNAAAWFYQEPEHNAYSITERLNGTFWQARMVGLYWRCIHPEPPFRAQGLAGKSSIEMEWMPGAWLSLRIPGSAAEGALPEGMTADSIVESISKRVLGKTASFRYGDPNGNLVYEWHLGDGKNRWSELQGRAEFVHPVKLKK